MKGEKWKLFKKFATIFTSLLLIFALSLGNIKSALAVALDTANFRYSFKSTYNGSYGWSDFYGYGTPESNYFSLPGYGAIRQLRIGFANTTFTGNSASLHFETNIVKSCPAGWLPSTCGQWVNLDYIDIPVFAITGVGNVTILSKNVNYAVTPWTSGNWQNSTLTVYGDVTVSGLPMNSTYGLALIVGSENYAFLDNTSNANNIRVYVEQNPTQINFSTNTNDALAQTQINQNSQIIQQNQQIINQDNQDRSDIQSASDSADSNADAAQSQNQNATSNLLNLMGSFIEALQTPATNCRVPADLGNLDLGTIDFCTGKPAEFVPIINTISALVMSFAIYLVARHLVHSFIRITVFAQGGKE